MGMNMTAVEEHDERYVSVGEAALAIAALTAADLVRLGRIAQLRAYRLPDGNWEDLVNESIEKLLSGARRWPVQMPLVAFLREVIRSLASEKWRRHVQASIVSLRPESAEAEDDPLLQVADTAPDPERVLLARDLLERVRSTFAGDPSALAVLAALAEGRGADEIRRALGMSPRDYDTCRRRLRRGIARHFPEGLEE